MRPGYFQANMLRSISSAAEVTQGIHALNWAASHVPTSLFIVDPEAAAWMSATLHHHILSFVLFPRRRPNMFSRTRVIIITDKVHFP